MSTNSKVYRIFLEHAIEIVLVILTLCSLFLLVIGILDLFNPSHQAVAPAKAADLKVEADVKNASSEIGQWIKFHPATGLEGFTQIPTFDGTSFVPLGSHAGGGYDDHGGLLGMTPNGTTLVIKAGRAGTYTYCGYGLDAASGMGSDKTGSPASAVVYYSNTGETKVGVPCP